MKMKKLILAAGIALLLSGCAQPTFETVEDSYVQPVSVQARQMVLSLPEEAAALTAQSDEGGNIYFCDGYTVTVQVLEAGDLEENLRQTTGFGKDALCPIQTRTNGVDRYDWVWTSAGEGENQVCRGALLDDGVNHYVLTCMAGESQAGQAQEQWQQIFASFNLLTQDQLIRTGS